MRLLFILLALGSQLACADTLDNTPELPILEDPCGDWAAHGVFRLPVSSTRRPLIYIPESLEAGPHDLVLVLHGATGSPERMMQSTSIIKLAEERRFVAVFPGGTGPTTSRSWNAGTCCGYAEQINAEDVAFLEATTELAKKRTCSDRALAVGHSNGAMMAMRWACEGSGPDAFATSAGALLVNRCEGPSVPLLAHHGLADPIVPFEGGVSSQEETYPSVAETMAVFRERNECSQSETITIDRDTTCTSWECKASTVQCSIEGWEHPWPGGPSGREGGPAIEETILDWFASLDPTPEDPAPDDTGAKE